MGLPAELTGGLRRLTAGGSIGDLASALDQLLALAMEAVPSCLAVTLVLRDEEQPVSLTALVEGPAQPVRSSVALAMPRYLGSDEAAEQTHPALLVIYASKGDGLRKTGREITALLDLDPRLVTWDEHLRLPLPSDVAAGLAESLDDFSAVQRALGVLLDRGWLPDEGRVELTRLAALSGASTGDAARALLADVPDTEETDEDDRSA